MNQLSNTHLQSAVTQPTFSIEERLRRYRLIRARMEAKGIDVLILPPATNRWEQSMADSRYVTGVGGFGTETLTILTREHEPTCYLFNRAAHWRETQDWFPDVRDGQNRWGHNVIARLEEIGFASGTIGISGLGGQTRTPDGIFPYGVWKLISDRFQAAKIIDASDVIQEIRTVKSLEEIKVMEQAAAITDRMVKTMAMVARYGMSERQVYAAIVHTMLAEGGELPTLTIFGSGRDINHGQFVPSDRILQRGDIIVNELEARIQGYGVQTVAPVSIGRPSNEYREAVDIARGSFEAMTAAMRPGVTIGEVIQVYRDFIEREGKGDYVYAVPTMHARGLGDEIPAVIRPADADRLKDVPLKENMVFIVKPRAVRADGRTRAQMGDSVQVTWSGGRRLGKRPLELIITD